MKESIDTCQRNIRIFKKKFSEISLDAMDLLSESQYAELRIVVDGVAEKCRKESE